MTDNIPNSPPIPASPSSPRSRADTNNSSGRPRAGSQPSHNSGEGRTRSPFIDHGYRPSIRIRRSSQIVPQVGSSTAVQQFQPPNATIEGRHVGRTQVGRNRSISAPQPMGDVANAGPRMSTTAGVSHMPNLKEEVTSPTSGKISEGGSQAGPSSNSHQEGSSSNSQAQPSSGWRPLRRARTNIAVDEENKRSSFDEDEYEPNLVDILDVVDPEVATLSTLTNLQNSLFLPNLGKYLNRRATYTLTRHQPDAEEAGSSSSEEDVVRRPAPPRLTTGGTLNTISSAVNDKYYAVLPHGTRLPGWTEEEKLELNDHVRHMLHSKRSKFKRRMKGFGQYVKRPLGFFVTLYATLITLFGLAWVLFLIGWINVGGKQLYIINVIDNVLVALFAVMGDGLAPFRAVDAYHMIFIAHYHHLTWRLRKEQALPKLSNKNDLPAAIQRDNIASDLEKEEFSVLTEEQQRKLTHHQRKFANSHSFYKPHETVTHHAFPLRLLVAVVCLLDCHSFLQIALGTCTWSINYKVRPFALTTVILCCSITCNITAGVLISVGDHKTRKKDVLERMERQELTAHAMRKLERKKEREIEESEADGDRVGEGGVGLFEREGVRRGPSERELRESHRKAELQEVG